MGHIIVYTSFSSTYLQFNVYVHMRVIVSHKAQGNKEQRLKFFHFNVLMVLLIDSETSKIFCAEIIFTDVWSGRQDESRAVYKLFESRPSMTGYVTTNNVLF
jgi:hypothetical protein